MIAITLETALRIGATLGAFYGFIVGLLFLAYMVTRPTLSVGVIGAAITALSMIALGAGSALIVGTLTVLAVATMAGIAVHMPQRLEEVDELVSWEEPPRTLPVEFN